MPLEKVVVVIVNWKRPGDTIECVRSVLESGITPGQVWVVDNGSQDGSAEQILCACQGIGMLALPNNLGFAGGYNAGIQQALAAGAERVFLLNNDTVVDKAAITALASSEWDVAVPKILFYDQSRRIWAAGAKWRKFPPSVIMIGYQHPDGVEYDRPRQLQYATGCALMVKRQVLDVVVGFDQDFENYMEDYDLFYRVGAAGFKTGYIPTARVLHKVSQTLGADSPLRWRYLGRNTVLFYRKGRRFPAWMLWSYLGWFLTRELLKGQARYLPSFWQGVREGFERLRDHR